jgi:malonate transporter
LSGAVFGGLPFLGYGDPILPQATVTMAIPAMPIVVMLALEYHLAEEYAPSIILISTLASLFTVGGFISLPTRRNPTKTIAMIR